jgi:hypothetical protein
VVGESNNTSITAWVKNRIPSLQLREKPKEPPLLFKTCNL